MFGQLIGGDRLGAFQIADLGLIGLDDRRAGRTEDALQQRVDLPGDVPDLLFAGLDRLKRMRASRIPGDAEHRARHLEQSLCGLQCLDNLADLALDPVARDRLAVSVAGFCLTQVVGVVLVLSLHPGRPQRHATAIAADDTAQREVRADIGPFRSLGSTRPAVLHLLKRLDTDQRFMLALEPVQPVALGADVSRIERLFQDVRDTLLFDLTMLVAREVREAFEEPLDLSLTAKAAIGIALEGLADDAVEGRVRDQHLASTLNRLVAHPNRGIVHPVAALHPRPHLLGNLASVLFALEFALRGNDRLEELAFRGLLELEVQTFDRGTAGTEGIAQIEMEPGVAGEPLQVVEDHDEAFIGLGVDEAEQGHHAWAFHEVDAACDRVREQGRDLIAARLCILATSCFLRLQPVTVLFLVARRDAAINQCFR